MPVEILPLGLNDPVATVAASVPASPQNLHFLARMMKDVMSSSGIVQAMQEKEKKAQAAKLDAAVTSGDIDAEAADKARRILGFA